MDIKLNEDQIEIARQARRFCENESPMDYVRAMFENDRGFTNEFWAKQAEMGWMAMCVPEAYGGLAMPLMDLAVVLEEMGRALVPGPFFSTVLLAAEALLAAGNDSQKKIYLSAMAEGNIKGTLALHEPEGGADPAYINMSARSDGDGYVLEGTKIPVPDAHVADVILCAARTGAGNEPEKGVSLFLVDPKAEGLSITLLPTMDGTRKLCAVVFKGVRVDAGSVLGEVNGGWAPLMRVLRRAQVALCAESLGGAHRAMEIATEYAKERIQFDQPIGAFQAVKHRCAQVYVEVESARSLLYWAAWAQDNEAPDEARLAASVAKAYCSEVYRNATTSAIQVLGGTGFSWEHDIHLYLKRAKANEAILGDPAYHREQVARLITAV
jgi:alkylation response protein AidB-like acyl-CoA dehydrogenase